MAKISKADLEAMSVEELEKFIQDRDEEVQNLRAVKAAAHSVLDTKNAEIAAAARYEAMSDPERRALMQYMKAEGIASEEAHGTPGT